MCDIIYLRRTELGLTQEEVARAVGVSKATVCMWEKGNIANMRRDRIEALARVLQVSPLQIIGLEPQEKFVPTEEEKALIRAYRSASEEIRGVVRTILKV